MFKASILTDVYEDSFTEGELDHVNSWNETLEAKTKAELREKIADYARCKWSEIEHDDINGYEDWSEYWADTLVNNDNFEPMESERKEWKQGKIKLYVQRHHILVSELTEKKASL